MAKVQISVDGTDPVSAFEELASWLGSEPALRGLIQPTQRTAEAGQLGAVVDVLVVALGTGGTASVLATSLRTFLAQPRHSDVRVTVQDVDGRKIEIDAKRTDPAKVEELLRRALERGE